MHVTDWFPTILDLADISYTPDDDYALDGVSQVDAWSSGTSTRYYMLYNSYYNVQNYFFDMWTNGSFAIRNTKYKLMHAYDSSTYGAWYDYDDLSDDDDISSMGGCSQSGASSGTFTYYLFDLEHDPYETTNLYYTDDDDDISTAKTKLYAELETYHSNSRLELSNWQDTKKITLATWASHDHVRLTRVMFQCSTV
jgi:arylsulfatase A-like enzyme